MNINETKNIQELTNTTSRLDNLVDHFEVMCKSMTILKEDIKLCINKLDVVVDPNDQILLTEKVELPTDIPPKV
jgi:hypothetical protein